MTLSPELSNLLVKSGYTAGDILAHAVGMSITDFDEMMERLDLNLSPIERIMLKNELIQSALFHAENGLKPKGVAEMKLIACPICHDVAGLVAPDWRICLCGASGGQYNKDMMTATIGGVARVFGVGNPFFEPLYVFLDAEGKRKMRQKFYGQPDTDAWWGEYPGDVQIFRIESPNGPRLKVKIEYMGVPERSKSRWEIGENRVTVIDKRPFTIDGKSDLRSVVVPANLKPALRQTLKRKKT